MSYLIIIGLAVIILLVFIVEVYFYNKLKMSIARINEAENNIDVLIQKKYKLLEKGINSFNDIKNYKDEAIISEFKKVNFEEENNFNLNDILNNFEGEFRGYIELDKKIADNEDVLDASFELVDTNNELNAAKKYYNRNTVKYNKLVRCFPSNIIALIYKYKVKEFYSEEKVESLEILKKK